MDRGQRRLWIQRAVIGLGALPAAALAARALWGDLGANPIETVTHVTGEWALNFLVATLAVTPLRRLLGWTWLAPLRRTLGLTAFAYAALHGLTFVGLDHFFDWRAIGEDVLERRYVTAGFAAFLCLLPLAATSTRRAVKRLGSRWVRLHRLAYAAAALAVVHYAWLVKADVRAPLVYAAGLALLLGLRVAWSLAAARRAAQSAASAAERFSGSSEPAPSRLPRTR